MQRKSVKKRFRIDCFWFLWLRFFKNNDWSSHPIFEERERERMNSHFARSKNDGIGVITARKTRPCYGERVAMYCIRWFVKGWKQTLIRLFSTFRSNDDGYMIAFDSTFWVKVHRTFWVKVHRSESRCVVLRRGAADFVFPIILCVPQRECEEHSALTTSHVFSLP